MKCEICGKEYKNSHYLSTHISGTHKIQAKKYYDTYLLKNNENVCSICNRELPFLNLSAGYVQTCRYCTGKYSCKICNKKFDGVGHLYNVHNISKEQYFNQYIKNENCKKCTKTNCFICDFKGVDNKVECKICKKYFNLSSIGDHIHNKHNISSKEYYDTYFKKPGEDICPICGKINPFKSLRVGYRKHCSRLCASNDPNSNNFITNNPNKNPEIREKSKLTNLKKYGVTNPAKSNIVKEKIKNTCLEKYGVSSPFQDESVKQKIKETNIERYGVSNPFTQQKVKDTIKTKYGGLGYASKHILEKSIQTNINRYGVENAQQNEEIIAKTKATNIKKYGHENPFGSKEIIENRKKHNLEKYGVEYITQSNEIMSKIQNTAKTRYGGMGASSDDILSKMQQTRETNQNLDDELNNADE